MAEIVQGFLAFALLADDDVGPKPGQQALIVEVDSAPPGLPRLRREIKLRSGIGGILQVAPGASRSVIESSGSQSKIVAHLLTRKQPAAGSEHCAKVLGQAFVDPQ